MWYQFEMNKTFLPIYIMKNVILVKAEYLNRQSIYQNKIYRMHRIHKDVSAKKILLAFMNKQQLYRQKTVLTTSHTHIYTASQACSEDNLEHKM